MRLYKLLVVLLLSLLGNERHGSALKVNGVDVTHFRTRDVGEDDNGAIPGGFPPPIPPSCDNSTECPDTFCPQPIIRCDCCKTCKQDCRVVLCARPPCPKPIIPPGECCGQCEADCRLVDCAPLDCPVAKQTHEPGACCATCQESDKGSGHTELPDAYCPDDFCPNPIDCNGCKVCRQDCRVVSCIRPSCPNPVVAPGECCGTCERDCRTVRCARPLCANPTYAPGACCPTCNDDNCKFKGCVNNPLDDREPTWQPHQCMTCKCSDDGERVTCVGTPCAFLNCSGRPFRTVPGNCCPTCDHGISDRKCGVVPKEERVITVRQGSRRFQENVTIHGCDKLFIQKGAHDTVLSCVPKMGRRKVRGRRSFTYQDVVKCKPVRWSSTCDLFVE